MVSACMAVGDLYPIASSPSLRLVWKLKSSNVKAIFLSFCYLQKYEFFRQHPPFISTKRRMSPVYMWFYARPHRRIAVKLKQKLVCIRLLGNETNRPVDGPAHINPVSE